MFPKPAIAYLKSNAAEICDDAALRIYSIVYSFSILLSVLTWELDPVVRGIWGLLLLAALASILMRHKGLAYVTLWFSFGTRSVLLYADIHTIGIHHFVAFLTGLILLLAPDKKKNLSLMILLCYFVAGLMKLNTGWISGQALFADSPFGGKPAVLLNIFVIFFEIFFVWGILSQHKKIRIASFATMLIFHCYSYFLTSYSVPLTMLPVIAIFPILEYYHRAPAVSLQSVLDWSLPRFSKVLIIGFLALEAIPFLLSSDPTLTGEARVLNMNIMGSAVECENLFIYGGAYQQQIYRFETSNVPAKVKCEPALYWEVAKDVCSKLPEDQHLSFQLRSKRTTDKDYKLIVDEYDFCPYTKSYSLFYNEWVRR